jgi:hypothetical protein
MSYPKWKYRKHPVLAIFQSTLVLSLEAETELEADWSDNPAATGFQVRPATQLHTAHITDGLPLHEVVTDATGAPLIAEIAITTTGDALNA